MEMKSAHVFRHDGRPARTSATILVPGLGEVQIENVISAETVQRIEAEAIAALQTKLGRSVGGAS